MSPFQPHGTAAKTDFCPLPPWFSASLGLDLTLAWDHSGSPSCGLYASVLRESHFAMLLNGYIVTAVLWIMKNFLSQALPLELCVTAGTVNNCWVRNFYPVPLPHQSLGTAQLPRVKVQRDKVLLCFWSLAHRSAPNVRE